MGESAENMELVQSLKQLIVGFGPYLRQADSVEQAEDSILHMEENDENFHRYDFVRRMQTQLEASLGNLIDEELDRHEVEPEEKGHGQEPLVSNITDQIINSQPYENLLGSLHLQVGQACSYLLDNFDTEFGLASNSSRDTQQQRPKSELFFDDGDSSLGDSSLNQSAFMLMNSEQFSLIAHDLDKNLPMETRKGALVRLMQASSVDVQSSEVWGRVRKGLLDALVDTDQELWGLSLKFFSRGFSSTSNPGTRDLYTTLVEFLILQFNASNKSNMPKVKNGLDCRKVEIIKILRAFRLLNEVQHQVPQYWIRYPERFLEEILDTTLDLLNIHYTSALGTPAQITPMHCMALLDTKASWVSRWLHGHYSRDPMLTMMKSRKNIVINAVQNCMDYTASRRVPFDLMSDASEAISRDSAGEGQRMHYTGTELEYVYFVHSLFLLGRMLCYTKGRDLFPVKLKDRDENVTVTGFVVCLVQILTVSSAPINTRSISALLDPTLLVLEVFRKLCSTDATCRRCMCKDAVTNTLLAPISACLDRAASEVTECTLRHVADVIAMLASSSPGRHHLLYGEGQAKFTRNKSSPAHVLALFVSKGLAGELQWEGSSGTPGTVLGSYIYLSRMLGNTCEGLLVLYPYDLPTSISSAWAQAMRDADSAVTPTPSVDSQGNQVSLNESQYLLLWEDMLRDNLLNIASTPKGVLLLQQTKAMKDCVTYMDARYARKLQVSKCEKFGYGYMVSQVAGTAVGMAAISSTEFIRTLIRGLWDILEGIHDKSHYTPRTWPVTEMDKAAVKPFMNLVGVMSSYPAVFELLADQALPTKEEYTFRDVPETIPGFLDRVVIVDAPEKMHALFNYEQSHVFGLRLLSTLISCLDTLLLLQTQYDFQNLLLRAQNASRLKEGSGEILIDMLSVERNYVLVKSYVIGGPSERTLPPRSLVAETTNSEEPSGPFPYPLFSSYPIPKEYMVQITTKPAMKTESELSKYLSETKKSEANASWLDRCRRAFCSLLTTKPEQARGPVLRDLLERVVAAHTNNREEAIFPLLEFSGNEGITKGVKLTQLQLEGAKMAIRYGQQLHLVSGAEAEDGLLYLLKQVDYYLLQQQRTVPSSPLRCLQKGFPGFDWFVATVYLIMNGNTERAWRFLQKFSSLATSGYLWLHRLHASVHMPAALMHSAIPPMFSSSCHNIELVLQAEVKHVHSAFKMSGYSPAQICQHWLSQCFWNYLDWLEICHYVCLCMMLGADYQVYICVAILKFRHRDILHHTQEQDLVTFLKETPLTGFHVGEHLEYMQQLEKKFRPTILPDMLNISKP